MMHRSKLLIAAAFVSGALLLALSPCSAQDTSDTPSASEAQDAEQPSHLRENDIPAMPGMRIHKDNPEDSSAKRQESDSDAPQEASAPSPGQGGAGLSYTVRSGDSLGAISELYGLDLSDLARANHLDEDSILHTGQVIKVPNPFAAQVRRLQAKVEQLTTEGQAAGQKERIDGAKIQSLGEQVEQLKAANQELQHNVRVLPWWRGTALTTGAAALLMLGVTALTILEWLILRRRFKALVEANESIRRLDQRYKVALAKAELRLQQLYGRRRASDEDQGVVKSPDEIEIERLDQQLKELLARHLEKLGLSRERAGRRDRLADLVGGVEEPAGARAGRR
jgi:LysM repeat protein